MGYYIGEIVQDTYNGYKNYETWNVVLWLGSDYPLHCASLGYKTYPQPYLSLRKDLRDGMLKCTHTGDGVSLWDKSLDIEALDRSLRVDGVDMELAFDDGMAPFSSKGRGYLWDTNGHLLHLGDVVEYSVFPHGRDIPGIVTKDGFEAQGEWADKFDSWGVSRTCHFGDEYDVYFNPPSEPILGG